MYLKIHFSFKLDDISSPEQLPVPERCDSLHSSINNVNNNNLNVTTPTNEDEQNLTETQKETNTNISSALEGKKVVLPQMTTADVSSESE